MSASEYIFSVRPRQSASDKSKTFYEVMVRMIGTDYDKFPISVGGMDRPYTFTNRDEAIAQCHERIAEKQAQGLISYFETFNYPSKTIVHGEQLDTNKRLEVRLHDVPEADKYTFSIVYLDEQGEPFGRAGDGQWYETKSACHAGGYIHYIKYYRDEGIIE